MPILFLGNADTESMVVDPLTLSQGYRRFSVSASRRYLWMIRPGDAIILPAPGDSAHVRYIEMLSGFDAGSLRTIYAHDDAESPCTLSLDGLMADVVVAAIRSLDLNQGGWAMEPYIADQMAFDVGKQLGIPIRFGSSGTPVVEMADLFNDKRVFRGIAAGLGVPTAPGRTCHSLSQLVLAITALTPATHSCIVKLDRHSGAEGNVLVTLRDLDRAAGTHKVRYVQSGGDFQSTAQAVYTDLARGQTPSFVVESYYHDAHSVGIHYLLTDDRIVLNGIADIRLSPTYSGMLWPTSLSDDVVHRLLAEGHKLAMEIARLGYRGPISVDAIVLADEKIFVNEVNARHGGFTAAKAIMDRLIVSNRTPAVAATRTDLRSSMDFKSIVSLLEREHLGFTHAAGKGIVIMAEDLRNTGRIEIFTIAENKKEIASFERRFVELVCQ